MTGQPDSAEAIPLAATPPGRPNASFPPLLRLPLELHHLIAAHLSLPGYLALRLTHPYLYNTVTAPAPTPSLRNLDSCARLAVRTYLAPYFCSCSGSSNQKAFQKERDNTTKDEPTGARREKARPHAKDTSKHCLLCATCYGPRLFKSTSSPAVDAADHGDPVTSYPDLSFIPGTSSPRGFLPPVDSTNLPAVERGRQVLPRSHPAWDVLLLPDGVCAWHVGRFARVVHEWPASFPHPTAALDQRRGVDGGFGGEDLSELAQQWCWYAFTSTLCPHCGAVGTFKACTCTRESTSKSFASSSSANSSRAATDGCTHVIDRGAATAPQQQQPHNVVAKSATAPTNTIVTQTTAATTTTTSDDTDNSNSTCCQTCALRPVTVYVRYLPTDTDTNTPRQQAWNISSYRFWRDADDRLWVREEGFVSSSTSVGAHSKGDDGGGGGGGGWGFSGGNWAWSRTRVQEAWSWGWSGGRGGGESGRETERERRRVGRREREMRVVDVPVKWIRD